MFWMKRSDAQRISWPGAQKFLAFDRESSYIMAYGISVKQLSRRGNRTLVDDIYPKVIEDRIDTWTGHLEEIKPDLFEFVVALALRSCR
jgi:hypothetical protein